MVDPVGAADFSWGLGRIFLVFSRQNLGRVSGVGRAVGLESIAIDWCRVSCLALRTGEVR
jgi:hypothetical protein